MWGITDATPFKPSFTQSSCFFLGFVYFQSLMKMRGIEAALRCLDIEAHPRDLQVSGTPALWWHYDFELRQGHFFVCRIFISLK